MWAATALLGLVMVLWTVAVPAFRAPDEAAHLDLVLYLADGHGYPSYDGRYFGEEANLDSDRHLVSLRLPWPRFDAEDAVPRGERPDAYDLGLEPDRGARRNDEARAGYPYVYNQMPQHPPVPYLMQAQLLKAERWLLPGHGVPSMDKELGLLRLLDVLLVLPMPLLAWAVVAGMGGSDRAGTVAALLPLGVPQLLHIGSALTNDALLILEGGLLAVLLTGVGRGGAVAPHRPRRRRRAGPGPAHQGLRGHVHPVGGGGLPARGVDAAPLACRARRPGGRCRGPGVGAWWWVANWVREGEPAPTTETLTRTEAQQPPGFEPDSLRFLMEFPGRLLSRTWAWVGHGSPKFELPGAVTVVLSLVVLAAGGIAWWTARRGRPRASPGRRRAVRASGRRGGSTSSSRGCRRSSSPCSWPGAPSGSTRRPGRWRHPGSVPVQRPGPAAGGRRARRRPGARAVGGAVHAGGRRRLQAWVLGEVVDGAWSALVRSVRCAVPWPGPRGRRLRSPWSPRGGRPRRLAAVDAVRALRRPPA